MKSLLQRLFFYISLPFGGEFRAESGTLWFRFLDWLYEGDMEPEFDTWLPEDDDPCEL